MLMCNTREIKCDMQDVLIWKVKGLEYRKHPFFQFGLVLINGDDHEGNVGVDDAFPFKHLRLLFYGEKRIEV